MIILANNYCCLKAMSGGTAQPVTQGQGTREILNVNDASVIPAGKYFVEVANIGNDVATIGGVSIDAGRSLVLFTAYLNPIQNIFIKSPVIPYDATASALQFNIIE